MKQDRTAPRTASDIERRFNNKKTFAELLGLAQAAQDAAEQARKELEGLTAEEIFNILTDGGTEQGIYRLAGKIYLNASYIMSGVLLADLIQAGVLQSKDGETFYLDLENGVLNMNATSLTISGKDVEQMMDDKISGIPGYDPTFEDIFNALTENGAKKGIYLEDGELYINATYIKSGEFVADLIKTGVLQSKDGTTFYLDLDNGILKGNFTEFSISGKSVATKDDISEMVTTEDLNAFENSVTKDIENIQSQLDGNITSWFYDHVPTMDNEPAVNWTTDADKNLHLGDLFYIVDNEEYGGLVYRWALINETYQWTLVEDSEVAKALADAAEAKDIADGKRRVFVVQPIPPYDVGDLWAQGGEGDLMLCKKARTATESYVSTDWDLASKYIDADQAGDIAQEKVDSQTQEDIFNKLTNNGAVKGIYLENGELYINATYIKSGELVADLIKAGVLQSKDGSMSIDLDSGAVNFFGGLFTNGLTVKDGASGDVELFKVESYKTSAGTFAHITAKGGSGNDAMKIQEVSNTDLTPVGVSFSLYSEDGVFGVNIAATNTHAYVRLTKDGSGIANLEIDENGDVNLAVDNIQTTKIYGKSISWRQNDDGTCTLIGRD